MALKISDLSVGDWVKASGVAKRIHSIEYQNGVYFVNFSDPDTNSEDYMHAPSIEPISITAEILEENGFTRRNGQYPIYEYTTLLGKMGGTIEVSLNYPYSYIICRFDDNSKEKHEFDRTPVNSIVVKNPIRIHDLQHVLRLAGVEKEINL